MRATTRAEAAIKAVAAGLSNRRTTGDQGRADIRADRRPIVLLGLLVFICAGLIAFTRLNIEAYPNPAPVILEITAQAAGLSAEEMERYYTIPMEVGLAATPGVDIIRSTSFYGLSFVRVTFRYGVDYYFALNADRDQSAAKCEPAEQCSLQFRGRALLAKSIATRSKGLRISA